MQLSNISLRILRHNLFVELFWWIVFGDVWRLQSSPVLFQDFLILGATPNSETVIPNRREMAQTTVPPGHLEMSTIYHGQPDHHRVIQAVVHLV